jgi:replicative DNA helicase
MNPEELERGLPQAVDSERMVLAQLLMRGLDCFSEVRDKLTVDDFAMDRHKRIWQTMEFLAESESAIDHVTVCNRLRETDPSDYEWLSHLLELEKGMPLLPNFDSYVSMVREKSARRRGALLCQQAMNRFLSDQEESSDVIASLISAAQDIDTNGDDPEWKLATDIIREFPGGWQALISPSTAGAYAGIPFPWPRVQQITCGMQKGELTIIAARPSMGKSAIAMQIATHAAKQNFGVAYVSLEMSGASLVRREVAQEGRIDAHRMKLGYLNLNERTKLVETRSIIETLPVHIESKQRRGKTAASILASLRYLKSKNVIDLVVIDHFHLIDGPEREERIKYNRIADALQRAARDMDVPFVVLAQLNRKCEEERREPGLPDLKECGKIEENADLVLFVHRPEMYAHCRDREDLRGVADLIIGKQRDGQTGKVPLVFLANQLRFESAAEDIQ